MTFSSQLPSPEAIKLRKLVAVEGIEEVRFLGALMDHMGLADVEVRNLKGKASWATKLRTLAQTPGFHDVTSLGIMRDADADADAAFQSVRDALTRLKLGAPQRPLSLVEGHPRIVVLILPHQLLCGMLEDVCLQAVANDPAMTCVDGYFDCLREKLSALPRNMSKARVHAFLSSREDPDLRLGEAASAGYWPLDDGAFDCHKQFLAML